MKTKLTRAYCLHAIRDVSQYVKSSRQHDEMKIKEARHHAMRIYLKFSWYYKSSRQQDQIKIYLEYWEFFIAFLKSDYLIKQL